MKKVVVCGGHLTPALALIEELEKRNDVEIVFFGRRYPAEGIKSESAEYKLVRDKKIKFYSINAGRLQRKFTRFSLLALSKTPIGLTQSIYFLRKETPDIVVSFGGYVSLPVVIAAKLLGIKCITHEQGAVPGLANRLNAHFCDQVFLAWPQTQKYFEGKKVTVIGNPVQKGALQAQASTESVAIFIKNAKKLIFITGGNQGSHFINNLVLESLKRLTNYKILHQVGLLNYKGDFDRAKEIKKNNYLPVNYLNSSDFGAAVNNSLIVISRCGANTIWELATLAKPSILIPLPFSASNEQTENAKILESSGSAIIVSQKDANPETLKQKINLIEKEYEKFESHAKTFAKSLPKDAAEKLAQVVLGYT